MEYQDRCEIIRMDGTVDAFGEEIGSPIYNGKADLQLPLGHSGNPYTGFEFEHEPILFIPVNNIFSSTFSPFRKISFFPFSGFNSK